MADWDQGMPVMETCSSTTSSGALVGKTGRVAFRCAEAWCRLTQAQAGEVANIAGGRGSLEPVDAWHRCLHWRRVFGPKSVVETAKFLVFAVLSSLVVIFIILVVVVFVFGLVIHSLVLPVGQPLVF